MARPAGEINAGSMADIAFLLLTFFLMTTTMDVDAGLLRRLPPMPDENQKQDDSKVNRRNILVVLISSSDKIYAGGQPIDISQLRDKVREFVLNENDNPNLPEKEIKDIPNFGPYLVSKGIISLQNDRGTTYDVYLRVQNELLRAYNELRDEFSMQNFGKAFHKLDEKQQDIVKIVYNQAVSEAEPRDIAKKR